MAIDLDAIRRKVEQLSGANKGKKESVMWKPKPGEYTVRVVPFKDNDGQPFKERYFYYGIGNNYGLLAPKQFGKPDPIQELIDKLRAEGTPESYQLCKKLYPKMRAYAAIIVRGEEDKGVQLWSFGKLVYQALLNIMLDDDYGDITDPLGGRDIKVTISKAAGAEFAKTDIMPKGKSTKLSDDHKQAKEWLDNVPDIDQMYTCKSYPELEKLVNDWLNAGSGEAESDGVELKTESKSDAKAEKKEGKANSSFGNLDDAFADLLEN